MPDKQKTRPGLLIFHARIAAQRLLERTNAEQNAVMQMSRDELSALAQQMVAVSEIAADYHIELSSVGSLPPDLFTPPTT